MALSCCTDFRLNSQVPLSFSVGIAYRTRNALIDLGLHSTKRLKLKEGLLYTSLPHLIVALHRRKMRSLSLLRVTALGVNDFFHAVEYDMIKVLYHPFILSSMLDQMHKADLKLYLEDEAYILCVCSSLLKCHSVNNLLLKAAKDIEAVLNKDATGMDMVGGTNCGLGIYVSTAAEGMKEFLEKQAAEDESGLKILICLEAILYVRTYLSSKIATLVSVHGDFIKPITWMDAFTSAEFQDCFTIVYEDLDNLLHKVFNIKLFNELQLVFKGTIGHQLQLFDSAWKRRASRMDCLAHPWDPVNLIFTTDYDVTCTVKDTSEILVFLAENSFYNSEEWEDSRLPSLKGKLEDIYWDLMSIHDQRINDCLYNWRSIEEDAFSIDMINVSPSMIMIPGMDPRIMDVQRDAQLHQVKLDGLSIGYDRSRLQHILRHLGDLEKKINKEVMAACVLRGSTRQEIRKAVKRIPLHNRCAEVVKKLVDMGVPIHMISANWSRDLIIGGLPDISEDMLFVHSNELRFNSEGVSDGFFHGLVQDAFDKEIILQNLRTMYGYNNNEVQDKVQGNKMVVFCGDSQNDLLALLDADLGIVLGNNKTFKEILSRFNVRLLPLTVAAAHISPFHYAKSFRQSGVLFEASGWAEIEACLFAQFQIRD